LNSGTEEQFLKLVDAELTKVEKFTLQQVKELRQKLNIAEQLDDDPKEAILLVADEIASRFLRLELYVNINFMGFHKVCCICCRRGWGMLSRNSPS
jgi:SPX domain protein involved in polyphosphate accumulation